MTITEPSCPRGIVTPDVAVQPGWPRLQSLCSVDIKSGTPVARPTPWLTKVENGSWDPWAFDEDRAAQKREHDLCQVCGGPRGEQVFVLRPVSSTEEMTTMAGGALCSLRCAALTASACPRYREVAPIAVYEVSSQDPVDLIGCAEANDDEYDLSSDVPVRILFASKTRELS